MDAQTLAHVMGNAMSIGRYTELLPHFEQAMREAGAIDLSSAAMFIAQLGHESVGLSATTEYASGEAYEGRRDLGNTEPGDGPRFKGRGWIQLTGRNNYRNCSTWAHERGIVPTPDYFITHPETLAHDKYAWVGAVWYWTRARPQLPTMATRGDLIGVTRAINGGLNGIEDRRARYNRAIQVGENILPTQAKDNFYIRLDFKDDHLAQDTGYFCGPASCQTVIRAATGELIDEAVLARELGTTTAGTDWIGLFPKVLNKHVPGAGYMRREMRNDPPVGDDKKILWEDLTRSLEAGFGMVANIVAPPGNYPRIVPPSTKPFQYGGGVVYHYVAVMGARETADGKRSVLLVDSGFRPYWGWISFDQLATLIPPKGYVYAVGSKDEGDNKLSAESMQYISRSMQDIREQLCGRGSRDAGYTGWPQLGQNSQGADLTLVDGVAALRHQVMALDMKLDRLLDAQGVK